MAILEIRDENLIQRLQALSQAESRPIESILQSLLDQFAPQSAQEATKRYEAAIAMIGMFDHDIADASTTVRETLLKHFGDDDHDTD